MGFNLRSGRLVPTSRASAGPWAGWAAVAAVCWALLAVSWCGCGRGGPERVVVSGTVTYQGRPLETGTIRFRPIGGTRAPASGAEIIDGQYEVAARGGVPVGTYRVQIVAHRVDPRYAGAAEPATSGSVDGGPPRQQYLPEKYNTRSELTLTIEPGSGPITEDFVLIP